MRDSYNLARFREAQGDGVYEDALKEIKAGRKRSHWMWYVFPQLRGLGSSHNADYYGIANEAEARAFLADPVLGSRLQECAQALLACGSDSAEHVFGFPDSLKLASSATLFAVVAGPDSVYEQVIERFFDGQRDARTLALLAQQRA